MFIIIILYIIGFPAEINFLNRIGIEPGIKAVVYQLFRFIYIRNVGWQILAVQNNIIFVLKFILTFCTVGTVLVALRT